MRVVQLSPVIFEQFYGGEINFPVMVYGGVVGDEVYVCGGLAWQEGRCWGYLDVLRDIAPQGRQLIRVIARFKRQAAQLGEKEIFVWRDDKLPTSARLLTLAGFELCGCHAETGQEIWSCQVSKP